MSHHDSFPRSHRISRNRCLGLFSAVMLLLWYASTLPVSAQDDADVHITPRIASNAGPHTDLPVDPSLRTYTKPMRSDVDMVLVPVIVTDPMDRLVTGLDRKNFEVFEGKDKQQIQNLSAEDAPVSVGILIDMSGSMANKFEKAREAVVQFMQSANPEDEFFIIGFSNRPRLLADFTDSPADIQSKLVLTQPLGQTALLDAIYMGMNQMRHARHRRKALLIISDGGDNHSRYTEREIKSAVIEADTQIFAIGIFDLIPRTLEESFGPLLLTEMTDPTGGRTFTLDNPNDLPKIAARISAQLRNQYVLAYTPASKPKDGKWHKIRVKLLPPKGLPTLSLYAKRGYYAAQE